MIRINDLVKLKVEPPRHQNTRPGWIGIVIDVRNSSIGQTITVLWPNSGESEPWRSCALSVVT